MGWKLTNRRVSAIVEKEAPINSSKVMIYCKKCKCGVRIGNQVLDDGSKVRLSVKEIRTMNKNKEA